MGEPTVGVAKSGTVIRKPEVLGNVRNVSGRSTSRLRARLLPSRNTGHGGQRDLRRTGHLGIELLGHAPSRAHEPQTKDRRALVSNERQVKRQCNAQASVTVE